MAKKKKVRKPGVIEFKEPTNDSRVYVTPATFAVVNVGASTDFDIEKPVTLLPVVSHNTSNPRSQPQLNLEGRKRYLELAKSTPGPNTATQIDNTQIDNTQKLPLGLQLCDVRQTLKRPGYKEVVTINNDGHWQLMEALMKAFPNAVSEKTLKRIFQGPNDRDNYTRALKNKIDDLGLTIEKWVLTSLK